MKPLDIVDIRNAMKKGDIEFVKIKDKIYVQNDAGEKTLIEVKEVEQV